MKKIQRMKNGRKYLTFALIFALLFGMADFPAKAQVPSAKMAARISEGVDQETAEWIEAAGEDLTAIAREREIMALVYLSDEYPVREQPSYESRAVITAHSGQLVYIEDVYVSLDEEENPEVWYYVSLEKGETEYSGYVSGHYLAVSDERFLAWEENYGLNLQASAYAIDAEGQIVYEDIECFPESYRQALTALKQKYPNWTFVAMDTGLDWNTVIANELTGSRSLVYHTFPACTKEGHYGGLWYYASEDVLKQYMDPRNGLTENAVFQFELLNYNPTYHTEEAVDKFLENTFMTSSNGQVAPLTHMTFSHIFWAIGKEKEISPFHLAARVRQEQGLGTSSLISGNYPGYEGYYNYFNVGASGKTDKEVIENGLAYAKEHGWKGAYYSILGGSEVIASNYIKRGQYTLYLQKFDVNPDSGHALYSHQYMQNISAPTTEALNIKKLYESAGSMNNTFVFNIPVFQNMPDTPCAAPTSSTNVALTIPSGYTDTTVWLDGVPYTATKRNGQYIVSAPDSAAKTAVVYQYSGSVPVGMYLWTLEYQNNAYAVTAQPELANLLTYHGFSIRVTGKSGIRFKTGISADLRRRLTSTGVGGYTLKEYGTLIMNNANRGSYPMVLGGEKVLSGMAYGVNASGAMEDKVYETVDGRYRYTSVLVGLPVDQYKTEYAFRGYVILERGGNRITVYGPVVAKSIYSLADQLLKGGSYAEGTQVYKFLKKLMSDADALQQ